FLFYFLFYCLLQSKHILSWHGINCLPSFLPQWSMALATPPLARLPCKLTLLPLHFSRFLLLLSIPQLGKDVPLPFPHHHVILFPLLLGICQPPGVARVLEGVLSRHDLHQPLFLAGPTPLFIAFQVFWPQHPSLAPTPHPF
ncbi:hypothetical protein NGA_2105800, partial [Nannochloropsis gaditana CCMP526]|uniref:uncharacterized protein n=1 Tax=Nannochloropsis gaditana (strain CCMP526) TaxID=1093141 RepID=UPI00029F68D2